MTTRARRLSAGGVAAVPPTIYLPPMVEIEPGFAPEGLTKALAADAAFWQPIVKAIGYKITN